MVQFFVPSFKLLLVYLSLNIPFSCVLHRHTTDSPLSQLIFFLLCPQSFAGFRFYLYVKRFRKKKLLKNYSGVVFLDVIVCIHQCTELSSLECWLYVGFAYPLMLKKVVSMILVIYVRICSWKILYK